MATARAAAPPGGGVGHQRITDQLAAHGVPAAASRQLLRAITSAAARERPDAERGLVVWRGMTGQVLVEVQCKPQTTVLQAKREIFARTGIRVEQQQLIGFGCTEFLLDDALISTVPRLKDCDGIQIIVDAPVRHHWADICEQEAGADEPSDAQRAHEPSDAEKGKGRASTGARPSKRSGKGRGEQGVKLQRHFILARGLQERDFDVLSRVKHRTKAIWQATNVSLRLHGPGSGQQGDERHLMLSLSAKRSDADVGAFHQAVQQAEDLIRSLNEQYRRFCAETHRRVPALGVCSEAGYRKGSHKPR